MTDRQRLALALTIIVGLIAFVVVSFAVWYANREPLPDTCQGVTDAIRALDDPGGADHEQMLDLIRHREQIGC